VTHREKIISRLQKMQAQAEGEAKLGNSAAAEAFAAAVNRMLLEHELQPSDIEHVQAADDPVIEHEVPLEQHGIKRVSTRVAWQEALASVVANHNMCRILVRKGSNSIWFAGVKAHAMVAEFTFAVLVRAAHDMSIKARYEYAKERVRNGGRGSEANGFREAWLESFVQRIRQRLDEERRQVAQEASTSTALVRLTDAMTRVNEYMKERGGKSAGLVRGTRKTHSDGWHAGRKAADNMAIGRKGVGTTSRGLLT
jgi:hypothetical protein